MDKKVMICDDDLGILEMLEMTMEDYGFQVFTEAHSINLLTAIEREKPDLILLDIWMPVLSGEQVLKSIKSTPLLSGLPVIMYSASTEGAVIAKSSGADDYIAKPFDLDDLALKIRNLIP